MEISDFDEEASTTRANFFRKIFLCPLTSVQKSGFPENRKMWIN